jgi:hypothetical protein
MEQNDHTTGACKTGVKVRITRQRMVGRIARHSSADIAAGVTTGHPWPFAPYPTQTGQLPFAANGSFQVTAGYVFPAKTCRSDFSSVAVVQFKDRSKPTIQLKPPISSV